jgi:branched-chain amino acid transport system substrate-binding protein
MYCAEDAACSTSYQHTTANAAKAGLNPVYGQQVSLAQPSFTAECLNAHSKGVLIAIVDANSVERVGRDCASQGLHPLYAAGSLIVTSSLAQDPQLEGMISAEPTFPWTFSASSPPRVPAGDRCHRSRTGDLVGYLGSVGLRQAVAGPISPCFGVHAGDPRRRHQCLYAPHNETLGGLAPPLNFDPNQPAPIVRCYFGVQILHGQWRRS